MDPESASLTARIDALADTLRSMIAQRALAVGSLRDPFAHFDGDGDGKITRAEFASGLGALGFALPARDVHLLLDRFDANGDGVVSFMEFVEYVAPPPPKSGRRPPTRRAEPGAAAGGGSPTAADRLTQGLTYADGDGDGAANAAAFAADGPLAALADLVRDAVESGAADLWECFEHFDTDFSGGIDRHEMTLGMRRLGIQTTAPQADAIVARFGYGGPGGARCIDYRAFLRLVQQLDGDPKGTLRIKVRDCLCVRYVCVCGAPQVRETHVCVWGFVFLLTIGNPRVFACV